MASLLPRTNNPRPPLPSKLNRYLNPDQKLIVKFQKIKKDGNVVVVGRVKVPTGPADQSSDGHAYVLRRYDTGHISATTMFRASFPSAHSYEERDEFNWIKANFDLKPSGRDGFADRDQMRLAGTWIPVRLAAYLAPSYNLAYAVSALGEAAPGEDYLKPEPSPQNTRVPTPPYKRRKAETSTPTATTNGTSDGHSSSPSKASSAATPKPASTSSAQKPVSTSKSRTSPAPSRSTPSRAVKGRKAASPAPVTQSPAPAVTAATSSRRSGRQSALPRTVEEDEEDGEIKPPIPDPAEDIAESQSLVQKLKAEQQKVTAPVAHAIKRTLEEVEAPMALSIQEHDDSTVPKDERALIHPSRVANSWVPTLAPNQKAAAWGTLAFAIGWGATTFLPQVLPQVLPQFF